MNSQQHDRHVWPMWYQCFEVFIPSLPLSNHLLRQHRRWCSFRLHHLIRINCGCLILLLVAAQLAPLFPTSIINNAAHWFWSAVLLVEDPPSALSPSLLLYSIKPIFSVSCSLPNVVGNKGSGIDRNFDLVSRATPTRRGVGWRWYRPAEMI